MANYETGITTKNKILEAYRELFYKKGYKKTTYVDILNLTGINQGLITYYFKSKKAIAGKIHTDFRIQIKNAVKDYFKQQKIKYDLQLATALEQIIYSKIKFKDEKLKRFIYEISIEGIYIEHELNELKHFWDMHVKEYNLPLSESEIKMIQVRNSSLTWGITTKMIEGYLDISVDEYAELRVRLMYQSMGLSEPEIDRILSETYRIYDNLQISLRDFFTIQISSLTS